MTLKFIHMSDTHLSRNYPATSNLHRVQAYNSAFNQVIETAIQEKVDFIVHTGDLFTTSRPFPRTVQFVNRRLQKLYNHKIPIIVIRGNHDGSYIGYGAYSGTACDYITSIMEQPTEIFDISKETPNHPLLIDPELYERHKILAVKSVRWADDLLITGCGYAGFNSQNYIRKWVLNEKDSWEMPTFLLLHDYIQGLTSVPPGYSGITVDELARSSDLIHYVGTGHDHVFHERRIDGTLFLCPGSTEAYDFSEANKEHYFIVGSFDGNEVTYEKRKIEPLDYIRYEVIESQQPQSAQWFKEKILEKINSFLAHATTKGRLIKIIPKGTLKKGEYLHQLEIPMLESKMAREDVIFSIIDISHLNPPELASAALGQVTAISPRMVFDGLSLPTEDKEAALTIFDFMQQQLDDDGNLSSTGNLKKQAEDQVRARIMEHWKLEEA